MARRAHNLALPDLQERVTRLGNYSPEHIQRALQFFCSEVPVIVHVKTSTLLEYVRGDTQYRNQFETRSSGGLNDLKKRCKSSTQLAPAVMSLVFTYGGSSTLLARAALSLVCTYGRSSTLLAPAALSPMRTWHVDVHPHLLIF